MSIGELSRAPLCALLLLSATAAAAQESLGDRAEKAYQDQDWSTAEKLFAELEKDESSRAYAAFRRGAALLYLGRTGEARASLDLAEKAGWNPVAIAYRRACAAAVDGNADGAFAELDHAVAGGFSATSLLDSEPLLASLREDPRFAAVEEAMEAKAHPCRHDPRYRAFDFWLGDWDVRRAGAPESSPPSENLVTLEYDGCVVMEHWTAVSGGTGSSFNIFDASRGMWFQTWVDSSGGLHEYHGNPDADGNMILEGEMPGSTGQPARLPTKLSFFRLGPDKVRQFSQSSVDGGKTWTTNYDLIYTRREKK
jgi:hypothetical protein